MHTPAGTLLDSLNPTQREAALAAEGPVLVAAGPGTGKTHTLTVRLAYLIGVRHVAPETLLAVTFTQRAAREMQKRLATLIGEPARLMSLGTFHGFCHQLLRADGSSLGLPKDFGVCDRAGQLNLLQECIDQLGINVDARPQRLLEQLSYARNQDVNPESWLESNGLLALDQAYRERLRTQRLLDFDDLLALSVELLNSSPALQQRYRDRYTYLSVDEYQDVNALQYRLLRGLAAEAPNLWVVGDADQAIYSFRGAQLENFLRFERDFPSACVIRLEPGYRSTPQIVAAANQVIAHNTARLPFVLKTDNPPGPRLRVVSLPDEQAEAAYLVREIEERVGGTSHYRHYQGQVQDAVSRRQQGFRDFAVLYRLNALARPLEETFARAGIPYRVVGGTRFFDRKAVKDTLAYLCVLRHPEDNASMKRILNTPPRGIGRETVAVLEAQSRQPSRPLYQVMAQGSGLSAVQARAVQDFVRLLDELRRGMAGRCLSGFTAWMLDTTGLQRWRLGQDPRLENDFLMLRTLAAQYDEHPLTEALDRFLAETALAAESDEYDAGTDAVTLMTLHAAKGLEFTEVFLCGLEEGLLPYRPEELEEERRLFYVGLTRARERVHLLSCRRRFLFGERREAPASRFLTEFDDALKEPFVVPDPARKLKDAEINPQISLL